MMTSPSYCNQNPSGFCFLVQIRSFVISTSLGLQNLNMKGKRKRIVVVVVKQCHRANGLLSSNHFWKPHSHVGAAFISGSNNKAGCTR